VYCLGYDGGGVDMIVYLLGLAVRTLFVGVIGLVKSLFGTAWTYASEKVTAFLALPGVHFGLGLYDTLVGIDFTAWALGFAVFIIITVRLIRLVIGLVSKG